ncbi:MAG: IS3 family transposase, partial [Synergistaceae bacterium]
EGLSPVLHSDRGCHYRWPGWIELTKRRGLIRSMSRKGCSPDNAACEGFWGRLKNECFYNRSFADYSSDMFIKYIDNYIKWYNEKRIKSTLGYLSPKDYRSLHLDAA